MSSSKTSQNIYGTISQLTLILTNLVHTVPLPLFMLPIFKTANLIQLPQSNHCNTNNNIITNM